MKSKIKNVLILASSMLLMASCAAGENTSSMSPSNTSDQSTVATKLAVKEIAAISVGDTIDISDYVEAPEGASWDYEILDDGFNEDIMEIISSEAPSLSTTTTLRAVKAGNVTFKVTSGDELAIGHFTVNKSEAWKKIDQYVETNTGENFTVTTSKKLNSGGTQSDITEKATFYRTANYTFHAGDYYGIAFNEGTNMGYYYTMNGVEEKRSSSLTVGVAGDTGGEIITRSSYQMSYPLFSSIFNDTYIKYNAKAAQYFGDEHALVIAYSSSDKTAYNYFNNCFASSGYEIINSYICFPSYYCPRINDDGELEVYIIYSRSTNTINSNSVLAGPYKFKNIGNTAISALETFYKGAAPTAIAANTPLTNNLSAITSYTADVETYFKDLDGNKIATPDYFRKTLPSLSIDYAINDNAIKTNKFSLIDTSSEVDSVILYNSTSTILEYVEGDDGKYSLKGTYANGRWQSVSSLSALSPAVVFSKTYWNYGKMINTSGNTYKAVSINDVLAFSAIKQLVSGLNLNKFVSDTTNPFYTYGEEYSYMTFDIGANTAANKNGEIITKVADGDGKFYEYHIDFNMTNVNSTNIEEPAVSE